MTSLPHPVPSRTAHAIAALYGHEDDTLLVWQCFCAHAPERLSKALALAEDGYALVTSGSERYDVQADGTCTFKAAPAAPAILGRNASPYPQDRRRCPTGESCVSGVSGAMVARSGRLRRNAAGPK
jgi:hypothetical protein